MAATTESFEAIPEVAADAEIRGRDLIVMKFGGTSVGDTQKIIAVARRLVSARETGQRVVGVLSAMGDTTDDLIRLAHEVSPQPHPREYDMLVSVGERISNALCAMAIRDLGHEAVSLTGSQAGIVTDTVHGKAKIVEVRARRLNEELDKDRIVLVAGFQGVSTELEVTTLGRGGSDATAVALASALGGACEIYTDVEGVFTADPRVVPDALKLPRITYEEMLEMAASGARVMMARSVEIARRYGVPLHVRAAHGETEGTWIGEEEGLVLEKAIISGVTHDTSEAKASILAVPDRPGVAARVFRALADAGVNIDMIVQNSSADGTTDITFTLPKTDLAAAEPILGAARQGDRGEGRRLRPRHREGLTRRRRHEEPSRRRRRHVRGARRRRDQHRDHLDVVHSRLVRRARVAGRRGCAGGARALPAVRRGARQWLSPRIAVIGATGAVGAVTMRLLRERGYENVRAFASSRSAGQTLEGGLVVEEATHDALAAGDIDLALFSVGTSASRELVPQAVRGGAVAVDKSSAYRLDPAVPLVVPEVNGASALGARRHPRESELLHDPADVRAEAAARRRGSEARARRDVPVGVGRRSAADGAAARRASGATQPRHGLELGRRRDRRGVEDPRRGAEDPRPA